MNHENANAIDIDVDKIIDKLLEVKDKKPGKQVNLTENEIKGLCLRAREVFISQPMLLELNAPLKICGNFCKIQEILIKYKVIYMASTQIY